MRVAYVVPRYGTEVVGGAELGARMLAERLARRPGWTVDVLTTCALDHMTWDDHYPEGSTTIGGVRVHRFRSTAGRPASFFPFSERLLAHPASATVAEAEAFIDLQGPTCPGLLDAVASSDHDLLAFYPYLYATTVRTVGLARTATVLHPAAHDEPALRLAVFRPVFGAVDGFAYHTHAERHLVERHFPVAHRRQAEVGLGFDAPPYDPAADSGSLGAGVEDVTGGRPYLLCLGRVDGLKGTTMLAAFFAAYKDRHPGPLRLVVAGPVTAPPPPHPDVVVTGPVDEDVKWALLRGATAVVQPSPNESFSLVLMEAWSQQRPVLVNGRCQATREHCATSGGGLWFEGYAAFEVAVDRLAGDADLRRRLGLAGRTYADERFRWPAVIDRCRGLYEAVAGSPRRAGA